jgi:hypothetical protein
MNEFQTIRNKILKDLVKDPNTSYVMLDISAKIAFFFYWIFDNLQILATIKFIHGDVNRISKSAAIAWFIGLVLSLAKLTWDLIKLLKQNSDIPESTLISKEDQDKKKRLEFSILKTLLDITGKLGDLIPASNGCQIPQKLFGKPFNDGLVGVGGLTSALVSLWNICQK